MIKTVIDFYSYLFQEEDQVTAAYFRTKSGTEYRVYFYPISEYFDMISEDSLLAKHGFLFGSTKMAPNEDKKEAPDFRIRNTILIIISEFFKDKGIDKVLIFHCDDGDGKKSKRAICFDAWFKASESNIYFKKYDEEIVTTNTKGEGVDTDFLSLIIERENSNKEGLLNEFQGLKEQLIANK